MSKHWPAVRLGEVLTERRETPSGDDLAFGRIAVVSKISFKTGRIELRADPETNTGMILARPGDLVVSGINAAKGAIAIYGPENSDPVAATIHYGAYTPTPTRADLKFLWWLLRSQVFRDLLQQHLPEGIKTELKSKRLLPIPVPLPPLSEQRRIVARIEALADRIHEARNFREESATSAEHLLICMAHRNDLNEDEKKCAGWRRVPLHEVITFVDDSVTVDPNNSYPNLGIYSFARGLFLKPPIEGLATSAKSLRRVRKGQFIYSRLFAFEGAYGMVTNEFDGFFVSQEYPTFDCHPQEIRAEFLWAYFKAPSIWKDVAVGSKGLGDRRQRVQPDKILAHELWLPPMPWQEKIAEVTAQVDALKRLQAETAAELDALLPSILDRAFKGEL